MSVFLFCFFTPCSDIIKQSLDTRQTCLIAAEPLVCCSVWFSDGLHCLCFSRVVYARLSCLLLAYSLFFSTLPPLTTSSLGLFGASAVTNIWRLVSWIASYSQARGAEAGVWSRKARRVLARDVLLCCHSLSVQTPFIRALLLVFFFHLIETVCS